LSRFAAPIVIGDHLIVSINQHDIDAYSPNEFVDLLDTLNPLVVKQAFENQLASLKNPPMTREALIQSLTKCGLDNASKYLK
jgi:hypothetical protein